MRKEKDLFEAMENSPKYPKIPKELSDIINILQEPEKANIDEIVERIQLVENLELRTINFINSEFFKSPKKVTSLREAIVFLGMNTMQIIIIAQVASYLFPRDNHNFHYYHKESYLKHSIGTAVASISIAQWLGEGNKYELFAYGLLHDIGVALYEVCFPEAMDKVQEMVIRGVHQIAAERMIFGGIDHTDIGVWFCEKTKLPSNILDVIANHHWPPKVMNRNKTIYIINLGDYISHIYYRGFLIKKEIDKPVKVHKENNPLKIPEDIIGEISMNLSKEVEKTLKIFKRF